MKTFFLLSLLILWPGWSWAVSAEDYYNAGLSLFQQKDYEKAIQYFHAAIQEKSDFWQAYQFLGEAYYQNSNRTEAVVAMGESLKIHSDNPELRKFLAMVKSNSPWAPSGSWRDVLSILSLVVSLLTLGWTLYWTQRFGPGFKRNTPTGQ